MIATFLRANFILLTASIDTRETGFAEATLFALLLTGTAREGTRFRASITAFRIEFVVISTFVALVRLHALAVDTRIARFAITTLLTAFIAVLSRMRTRFHATVAALGENLMIIIASSAFVVDDTFSMGSCVARSTEASTFAFLAAISSREVTRLLAAAATLGEELKLTVALLAAILANTFAMDTGITGLAEATLFTFLLTDAARERTRFHAPITAL